MSKLFSELGLADTSPFVVGSELRGTLELINRATCFLKTGTHCFGDLCVEVYIKATLVALKVTGYSHVETFSAPDYEVPMRAALKYAGCGVKTATHAFFNKYWRTRGQSEALANARDVSSSASASIVAETDGAHGGDASGGGQGDRVNIDEAHV